mmetsp:Transcript_85962/g.179747  ORF Transcript_85962/g.179747 Transcript_85962/m.179747 type:complete len:238 (-) Transcript_85962:646-1359(-)
MLGLLLCCFVFLDLHVELIDAMVECRIFNDAIWNFRLVRLKRCVLLIRPIGLRGRDIHQSPHDPALDNWLVGALLSSRGSSIYLRGLFGRLRISILVVPVVNVLVLCNLLNHLHRRQVTPSKIARSRNAFQGVEDERDGFPGKIDDFLVAKIFYGDFKRIWARYVKLQHDLLQAVCAQSRVRERCQFVEQLDHRHGAVVDPLLGLLGKGRGGAFLHELGLLVVLLELLQLLIFLALG